LNKSTVVILTVYPKDQFDFLVDCLESLYQQSFKDFDIMVQEDGNVSSEIHLYLQDQLKEKKIIYLGIRDENLGFDYSLNELLVLAMKKEYLYFARMDADDIARPHRLERQFNFMQRNKDIDVVGTNIREFGHGFSYSKLVTYPTEHRKMFNFFKRRVPLAHVSAFFRKSFFVKAGLYETEGHINNGDTIMWMKGFENNCCFANIEYVGVDVRVTEDFFSRRSGIQKTLSDLRNRLQVIQRLKMNRLNAVYSLLSALVGLSPRAIKKLAYKYLRR